MKPRASEPLIDWRWRAWCCSIDCFRAIRWRPRTMERCWTRCFTSEGAARLRKIEEKSGQELKEETKEPWPQGFRGGGRPHFGRGQGACRAADQDRRADGFRR